MIKITSERPSVGKLFPILAQLPPAVRDHLGLPAVKAEDASEGSKWAELGWQVVAKEPIENFHSNLAPFDAFSSDISGDTVVFGNLADKVFPKVLVNVENSHGEGTLDPVNLSLTSGSNTAVEVGMHLIASSFTVSAADIRGGNTVDSKVNGAVDAVLRGAVSYAFGKIKSPGTDTSGAAIAAPASVAVPDVENGWNSGYANRVISELVQPRVNALIVNKTYYGALKAADKESLDLSMLDMDGVYKSDYLDKLGGNVVGLVSNRRSTAFAMRTPYVLQSMYQSSVQFTHGATKMPLLMLQWLKEEEMALRVAILTAVGCQVVAPDFMRLLTAAPDTPAA